MAGARSYACAKPPFFRPRQALAARKRWSDFGGHCFAAGRSLVSAADGAFPEGDDATPSADGVTMAGDRVPTEADAESASAARRTASPDGGSPPDDRGPSSRGIVRLDGAFVSPPAAPATCPRIEIHQMSPMVLRPQTKISGKATALRRRGVANLWRRRERRRKERAFRRLGTRSRRPPTPLDCLPAVAPLRAIVLRRLLP